jgi:hypothetical protein
MDARPIVKSIRRLIGDTNSTIRSQRLTDQELAYFFQDAVNDVVAEIPWDNEVTITSTSVVISNNVDLIALALYKLKTVLLIRESYFNDALFDGGSVHVGDIKVDVTGMLKIRRENLDRLQKEYERLLYDGKMGRLTGHTVDTYVTGLIKNDTVSELSYE